jgi:hypothetical protein
MLRFNKISLLCRYHWKRGWAGKAERIGGEREGDFMNNFIKCFPLKNYEPRVLKLEK